MSVLDANATPKPGAVWPDGFKDRANAQAAAIVARDSAPSPLDQVAAMFPGVLLDIISGSPGMLPGRAAELVEWATSALKMCITSVTVETQGTVTVVDKRTVGG